jgi:hypothetical protein
MPSHLRIALTALVVLLPAAPAAAQDEKAKEAVKRAIQYLREIENEQGDFEHTSVIARIRPGGVTALAVVALLRNGVPAKDPLIQRGLKYLRTLPPQESYTVGLQTMAFCLAGEKEDRKLVERNLKWLKDTFRGNGWGYNVGIRTSDHSINFYVLLGLREAHRAKFTVDQKMLKQLREYYAENKEGVWHYRSAIQPTLTMTSQGLWNLLVTIEILGDTPTQQEGQLTRKALQWLGEAIPGNIETTPIPHPFCCLYGMRQLGDKTGVRQFGKHDWRDVGRAYLVKAQLKNGSWDGNGRGFDHWPPIATSLALLFLAPAQ